MTTITQPKQELTFEQFLQYPAEGRYELVDGEIVRILAPRQHEDVADFIADTLKVEVNRLALNYKVLDRIIIRTLTQNGKEQGRHPDVSVVDRTIWESKPRRLCCTAGATSVSRRGCVN